MSDVFDAYAAYYDLLYRDKDYAAEAEYIAGLIRRHAPDAADILELGCGTGGHAVHFSQMGYRVSGIDLSKSMLSRAEERRSGLPNDLAQRLQFSFGDVRTWRGDRKFDVVVSLFHVFSYQTTNEDLQAAFETAAVHLNPGGVLIFDFWYGPAVLSQRPEVRVRRMEDEHIRVLRIAEPILLPNENKVLVAYDVCIEQKASARRDIVRESHGMRYLFYPEIDQYAQPTFAMKGHLAWMKDVEPNVEDWSAVAVLEKSN